jgi:D-alanine-D-alanine ligase
MVPKTVAGARRVAIVYTTPGPELAGAPEMVRKAEDLTDTALRARKALAAPERALRCFPFDSALSLASRLKLFQPDVVFNLAEGPLGCYEKEPHAAAFFELLRIPYTGSGPWTLALCKDKGLTKQILQAHGVATPEFCIYNGGQRHRPLPAYPLVVKPLRQDGSLGITEASVVSNRAQLDRCVREIADVYRQDALVEQFLDGRELHISVVGSGTPAEPYRVFPPSEYVYHSPKWRVCTFEAKWNENHPSYAAVEAVNPAQVGAPLRRQLERITCQCAQLFGLNGYARVDFRLDASGRPHVLEVNPNPDLSPGTGIARAAESAGHSYEELLERIVHLGLTRGPR